MAKRILKAIYSGQLNPAENIVIHDRKYRTYMKKQIEAGKNLCLSMTQEQRKLFEQYKETVAVTNAYTLQKMFCKGFRIGAAVLLEVERG